MTKDQEEKYADQNDELQAEHAKCMGEHTRWEKHEANLEKAITDPEVLARVKKRDKEVYEGLTGGPTTTSGVPKEAQAVLDDLEAKRKGKPLTMPTEEDIEKAADTFAEQGMKIMAAVEEEKVEKTLQGSPVRVRKLIKTSEELVANSEDVLGVQLLTRDELKEYLRPDNITCGEWDELADTPGNAMVNGKQVAPCLDPDAPLTDTQMAIADHCAVIREMLISKNRKYGDSLFNPPGVFSKAGTLELINSRLDDKLSRLQQGDVTEAGRAEDEEDIIGYLILKRVYRALEVK